MSPLAVWLVLFLAIKVLAMIKLIADFQRSNLFWNLIWFLVNQMTLMIFAIQDLITNLHCWDQFRSSNDQKSLTELNWTEVFRMENSQFQSFIAKEHSKKRWKVDSSSILQVEHFHSFQTTKQSSHFQSLSFSSFTIFPSTFYCHPNIP